MPANTAELIEAGNEIRIYQEDDWFITGHVTELNDEKVTVDFDDHIVSYLKEELRPHWEFYQKFFYPISEGVIVKDFRPLKNC
jgi:hypothetical protein